MVNDEVKQPGDEPEDNPESAAGADQAPADENQDTQGPDQAPDSAENDADSEEYPGEGSAGLAATAGESEILKPDSSAEETDEERQAREEAAKAREAEQAERQERQAAADKAQQEALGKLPMPSVGRLVHYFDREGGEPRSAIVTAVQSKTGVSLRIFSSGAPEFDEHQARVEHELTSDGAFWCWPPKV